jgi:hypothetical protein
MTARIGLLANISKYIPEAVYHRLDLFECKIQTLLPRFSDLVCNSCSGTAQACSYRGPD